MDVNPQQPTNLEQFQVMDIAKRDDAARLAELSGKLIGAAYAVSNTLGCGFAEKVYENALVIELRERGIRVESQAAFQVRYHGELVGQFIADLVIEDRLLVELKAVPAILGVHQAQCINYLRASRLAQLILLNFGRPKVEIRRFNYC